MVLACICGYAQKDIALENGSAKSFTGRKDDTAWVLELTKKARSYYQTSYDSAFYFGQEAMALARKLNYKYGMGDAYIILGTYYKNKGNTADALEANLQALKIFELLGHQKKIASCYLNIAQAYKAMGGEQVVSGQTTEAYIKQAVNYVMRAYAIDSQLYDTVEMASSLNIAGIIFRDWAKNDGFAFYYDTAFSCYEKALQLVKASGKGTEQLAKIYNNMSHVYMEYKKDNKSALASLFKAVDINVQQNNLASLSFNYQSIADVYRRMGDNRHSIEYALKTLALTKQLNVPLRQLSAYGQLTRSYRENKQYDSALYYNIELGKLNDSLLNIEKTKQIAEMQTRYETVKKESEINRLSVVNSNKNRQIIFLIGGLAALVILAGAMIFLYRRVNHQRLLISEQSKQMETMMKELHHRVKNNLQIVSSLLSLQTYRLNDEGAKAAIAQSQQRVQAMSFIHQRLYKTENLTTVNMKEYMTDLVESLLSSYGYNRSNFDLAISVNKEMLDVDKALPIGLIVNEIVTNSFKYAYKGIEHPSLEVICRENGNEMELSIKDNGIAWDVTRWKQGNGSFGSQLVSTLCRQLRAKQSLKIENGTHFIFSIPQKTQTA